MAGWSGSLFSKRPLKMISRGSSFCRRESFLREQRLPWTRMMCARFFVRQRRRRDDKAGCGPLLCLRCPRNCADSIFSDGAAMSGGASSSWQPARGDERDGEAVEANASSMAAPKMMCAFSQWRWSGSINLLEFHSSSHVRAADDADQQRIGFIEHLAAVQQRMKASSFSMTCSTRYSPPEASAVAKKLAAWRPRVTERGRRSPR